MNILPISGGGGVLQPSVPSNEAAQPTDTETTEQTTQSEDTAAPAATSQSGDSATNTSSGQSDQQAQADKVTLLSPEAPTTQTQSVVEAQLVADPEMAEADARRMAEAAQQQQRLEMLIAAVSSPTEAPQVAPAAAAEQVESSSVDTGDGLPV